MFTLAMFSLISCMIMPAISIALANINDPISVMPPKVTKASTRVTVVCHSSWHFWLKNIANVHELQFSFGIRANETFKSPEIAEKIWNIWFQKLVCLTTCADIFRWMLIHKMSFSMTRHSFQWSSAACIFVGLNSGLFFTQWQEMYLMLKCYEVFSCF